MLFGGLQFSVAVTESLSVGGKVGGFVLSIAGAVQLYYSIKKTRLEVKNLEDRRKEGQL